MKKIKVKRGTEIFFALVDDYDFEAISAFNWFLDKNGYAMKSSKRDGTGRMHRMVMNAGNGQEVDHINRDKLDNRRSNLRLVTHHENCLNRTRGVGVSFRPDRKRWRARIKFEGKEIHLGHFVTRLEALEARRVACIQYFGQYAFIK